MIQALLIGYGKVNKLVHALASEQGVEVRHIVRKEDTLSPALFKGMDVAIDFSSAEGIEARIIEACNAQVPLVIGTTGWDTSKTKALVENLNGAVIYSPNYSIGVQLYMKLLKEAAQKLRRYDVALHEEHHNQKKDAPSGTAKDMARIILEAIPEKSETLTIGHTRCGFQPGKHTVTFDGPDDTIELIHTARSRNGFARGALDAARWIQGKKGFFTIEDLL